MFTDFLILLLAIILFSIGINISAGVVISICGFQFTDDYILETLIKIAVAVYILKLAIAALKTSSL